MYLLFKKRKREKLISINVKRIIYGEKDWTILLEKIR